MEGTEPQALGQREAPRILGGKVSLREGVEGANTDALGTPPLHPSLPQRRLRADLVEPSVPTPRLGVGGGI